MPPAFSQSAWVFAEVTSPAKAGPVTATATARAAKVIRAFIGVSPYVVPRHAENAELSALVPSRCHGAAGCGDRVRPQPAALAGQEAMAPGFVLGECSNVKARAAAGSGRRPKP